MLTELLKKTESGSLVLLRSVFKGENIRILV